MPLDSKYLAPFVPGEFFHVYNRCPSNQKMFNEDKSYYLFLELFQKYLLSYTDLYAYSLIPTHFHLFIKVNDCLNDGEEIEINRTIINQFRKLFISFTNITNKEFGTHGGIFSTPFRRILITNDFYFSHLIYYIHYNAVHHHICTHPSQYLFSSYNSILSDKPTRLKREEVLGWFGGRELFIKAHELMRVEFSIFP